MLLLMIMITLFVYHYVYCYIFVCFVCFCLGGGLALEALRLEIVGFASRSLYKRVVFSAHFGSFGHQQCGKGVPFRRRFVSCGLFWHQDDHD